MASERVVDEGETSSDSWSEPDADLLETEEEAETEEEEEEAAAAAQQQQEEAAAAAAQAAVQAAEASYKRKLAADLGNGGVILVLFEMPSGFAIFSYDGTKLLSPDDWQNVWAEFVHDYKAKKAVRLLDSGTFEDKDSAINECTGVNEALAKMIVDHLEPEQKLAVGKLDYKKIIESNMGIGCLCSPAVEELMWGLKISMGNFMPAEQSGLTNDYRLLMSQGMRSYLNRHSFGIKSDMMVTKQIMKMAGCLNQCDQRVNKYKYFLRDAAQHIMEISHIDTKDWDLMKLATVLKMICCPEEKNAAPRWLFPRKQLKIFRKHAPQYENKILKVPILVAYDDIYRARKLRYQVAQLLFRMIKRDKKALEAKLASEAASDHEIGMMSHQKQQMAPPSRGSENGFPNPKLGREGSGRHDNKTNLMRSSSGDLGGAGVVLKMARGIKDGSAADVVKKHATVIIPARELGEVFAKDGESSSYIFDDTDPSANIQSNNVSQSASDGSSTKPFSVGENRLEEKLSKDGNENLGIRNVQPENNLSGRGRPLIAEGLDGPPSISHTYESSAPETPDSTISVKHPSAVEPVTSSQRPGSLASSTSERIAANSFASAPGLSPSTPIGSLTSEKSTMNPNAKKFKLNPNAKSFTPSASLRPLHPPASDTSYYYPNNMPAAPLETGLPVGMGFPPAYGGHPVMYNTQPGTPSHMGYMHPAEQQYWKQMMMG